MCSLRWLSFGPPLPFLFASLIEFDTNHHLHEQSHRSTLRRKYLLPTYISTTFFHSLPVAFSILTYRFLHLFCSYCLCKLAHIRRLSFFLPPFFLVALNICFRSAHQINVLVFVTYFPSDQQYHCYFRCSLLLYTVSFVLKLASQRQWRHASRHSAALPVIFCLNYLQLNFERKDSIYESWRIALSLFVKWKFCNNPYLVNLLTLSDAFGNVKASTVIMISII